jgi:hypothetical protein
MRPFTLVTLPLFIVPIGAFLSFFVHASIIAARGGGRHGEITTIGPGEIT